MSDRIYEAHITLTPKNSDELSRLREFVKPDNGWTLSSIDGDPDLGSGQRAYLTAHSDNGVDLLMRMMKVVEDIGVPVARTKIEKIVFDSKTGVFAL